jgi:hypothetical protein
MLKGKSPEEKRLKALARGMAGSAGSAASLDGPGGSLNGSPLPSARSVAMGPGEHSAPHSARSDFAGYDSGSLVSPRGGKERKKGVFGGLLGRSRDKEKEKGDRERQAGASSTRSTPREGAAGGGLLAGLGLHHGRLGSVDHEAPGLSASAAAALLLGITRRTATMPESAEHLRSMPAMGSGGSRRRLELGGCDREAHAHSAPLPVAGGSGRSLTARPPQPPAGADAEQPRRVSASAGCTPRHTAESFTPLPAAAAGAAGGAASGAAGGPELEVMLEACTMTRSCFASCDNEVHAPAAPQQHGHSGQAETQQQQQQEHPSSMRAPSPPPAAAGPSSSHQPSREPSAEPPGRRRSASPLPPAAAAAVRDRLSWPDLMSSFSSSKAAPAAAATAATAASSGPQGADAGAAMPAARSQSIASQHSIASSGASTLDGVGISYIKRALQLSTEPGSSATSAAPAAPAAGTAGFLGTATPLHRTISSQPGSLAAASAGKARQAGGEGAGGYLSAAVNYVWGREEVSSCKKSLAASLAAEADSPAGTAGNSEVPAVTDGSS